MADEEEDISVEDVNIMVSALIDTLIKKGLITEAEFKDALDEYYEEE